LRLTEALATKENSVLDPFSTYLEENPGVKVFDPIRGQLAAVDRQSMATATSLLNQNPELHFYSPKTIDLDFSAPNLLDLLPSDFQLPAICKHKEATTVLGAHIMDVICTKESLLTVAEAKRQSDTSKCFLLQEYINHSGTIFKVYVLGDFVDIQRRVSFPDFPYEGQDPTKPFNFDSQQWKHELPPHLTMPITGKADKPPQDLVAKIAKCLGGQLGLTLFGFDMITNSKTGKHAIIDINYMPDYGGVTDFFSMFYDHITQ